MPPRPEPALDRQRLVAAAFAVLEDEGLEKLSMRSLAARLGVQAPALYWHIGDKAELLGMMAAEIYAAAYSAVPNAPDWQAWLIAFGTALRASLAGRRDGPRLCALAYPTAPTAPADHARHIAAPLVDLGLDQNQALAFQAAVIAFTLGWATFEANGPMRAFLQGMMDFEGNFAGGLGALVRGLGTPALAPDQASKSS
ncbi:MULTISPECIES: TetR family transcriptional regulator [unclassified Novosphingobium]|uniref:TetR family transcriptional regulator n=1 Tax=unclassified Novosphingobium TaxID=2644732 RepID=UPI00146CDB4B|nr:MULTISPECIES: TetR family transcriptional regulator [unclassified Novosphingobium]NMN07066.1 TetR/AcrR family tetracycline transcriptional repressor [Novosphingobium sp. SG919]NMN89346.1 TetR/AcrR family tetracycline transcriptional repressor [Novosphingobium sp. SG916]